MPTEDPFQPITNLYTVLANTSALLSNDRESHGLSTPLKRRGSVFESEDTNRQSNPEHESSASREEEVRRWIGYDSASASTSAQKTTSSGPVRIKQPWEQGYREPSQASQQRPSQNNSRHQSYQEGSSPPLVKSRKKPRPSKSRHASSLQIDAETTTSGLEDLADQEMDFEDSSGDYRLGSVFVHPPHGSIQACMRCHRIKRKCDGLKPRCGGCGKADVACIFELSPSTSGYVHTLKNLNHNLSSEIDMAQERIRYLESKIAAMEGGLHQLQPTEWDDLHRRHIESNGVGNRPLARSAQRGVEKHSASPLGRGHSPSRADFSMLAKNILSVRSAEYPTSTSPTAIKLLPTPTPSKDPFPPYQIARRAVDTFFMCNAISYPFLEKAQFLQDLDEAYHENGGLDVEAIMTISNGPGTNESGDADNEERKLRKQFIIWMVIAIGTTNRERLGEVSRGSSRVFWRRAMESLSSAIGKEDVLCVQALILLGIYSMFDPSNISLWHVVGFAARIAIALNLHRRVEDSNLSATVVEERKRLFYSLYNMDRLVATTLSKPLAIRDDDVDVELPSTNTTNSPYQGLPRLSFTQQIIKLRRLSGRILTTVYSVSGSQNSLPEQKRAAIILDLHSQLDEWLATCPLPSTTLQEERGMINNYSWFLLNYHQNLCLLYRPSPLYPVTTSKRLGALHEASSRCVDLYLELWKQQRVSYNLINVSAQFLACISLLYCLCEYDNRSKASDDGDEEDDKSWTMEVRKRVGQCGELLEAFSRALPETAKYREIFGRLSEILLVRHGPLEATSSRSRTEDLGVYVEDDQEGNIVGSDEGVKKAGVGEGTAQQRSLRLDVDYLRSPKEYEGDSISPHRLSSHLPPQSYPSQPSTSFLSAPGEEQEQLPVDQPVSTDDMLPSATAWNAMTQLWHDSGDFQFDETALTLSLSQFAGFHSHDSSSLGLTGFEGFEGIDMDRGSGMFGLGMGMNDSAQEQGHGSSGDMGNMGLSEMGMNDTGHDQGDLAVGYRDLMLWNELG